MTAAEPSLSALLRALTEAAVDFVVIGGVAVTLQALPRFTRDLDIVPEPGQTNLTRLGDVLTGLHARLRGVPDDLPFVADARTLSQVEMLTLECDLGGIDILHAPSGAPAYPRLREGADEFDLDGIRVLVAGIPDLISMKRAAGRPVDLTDVEALELALLSDDAD